MLSGKRCVIPAKLMVIPNAKCFFHVFFLRPNFGECLWVILVFRSAGRRIQVNVILLFFISCQLSSSLFYYVVPQLLLFLFDFFFILFPFSRIEMLFREQINEHLSRMKY